jgi:predicted NACHT family NTPase
MLIAEFALGIIGNLIAAAIQAGISYPTADFFEKRRIMRRIDDATAEAVEPLLPFLENEKVPEDKQRRLIQTCVDELSPFTADPTPLFQGSLNGQKIFENLYAERNFPQVITEDGMREVYTLLFPRIATLLCQIPAAVKDWEKEAWSENYKRLDEVASQIRSIFVRVDEMASDPSRKADETLSLLKRSLTQKIGFELDLTGLRADKPILGNFDDFFVHPEMRIVVDDQLIMKVLNQADSFKHFNKKNNLAILIGGPGAGKSTWAKWFQSKLLNSDWNGISIRKELRSLPKDNFPSIQELIREAVGKSMSEDLTADRINKWLFEGKIVFILDGFDEIRPSERDNVYDWIKEISLALRNSPLVITSRPLTTNHISKLAKEMLLWSIEPFDKSRIVEYIGKWYKNTPLVPEAGRSIDVEFLANSWRNDSTISHLTGNPLLLSTLLMVHHLDGSLPSGRSELYRRYVEGMLGVWDDRRKVTATSVELTLQQKRQILRALALHLFLIQEEQIEEQDILKWLSDLLNKLGIRLNTEEVLNSLRERTGLIIGPGIYSFSHKSIIEYFVAETVLQGDQRGSNGEKIDRLLLFEHGIDDRWNTIIFLWAGLAPVGDIESFINQSIDAGNMPLASGILQDQFDNILPDISKPLLLKLLFNKDLPLGKNKGYVMGFFF